ncbi:MAG: GNAT family protein [Actinomycetes bacterium]
MLLESKRLYLRQITLADENDLYQYQSLPEVVRYIPWPERTREQVREAIVRYGGNTRLEETGDAILLGWQLKSTGQVIGQSNLSIFSKQDQCGEFGYVVHPSFARQGYSFEASQALLDFAFGTVNLHRVIAHLDDRNVASKNLLEKMGLRQEAHMLEEEFFKGEWTSTYIYAMLKSEWEGGG